MEARWTDGAAGCPAGVRARAERPNQLDHTTATGTGLAGASVVRTQVWGQDLSGTMQGAGGVGGLLAVRHGGQTYVPLMDGNGNVMGLQGLGGAKDGQTVARYDYDAFGNRITNTAPELGEDVNPFGFSTKFTDEETGLVYYGYRYYSSEMGRWLNRDPIGERGGINLYGMVNNEPVNRWDYLGLADIQLEMKSLQLQRGNCGAVRWDVQFTAKNLPEGFTGKLIQKVQFRVVVLPCDGAKTPFSLDQGTADALGMKEGDQVWSVKGGTGFEGWNTSGPMKDSWYNPDQRTASKGAACKGYHITRASAWIAADAPGFVPAPATPPPPQNDMFPFVSPQSPLFPADIALPPNQNNGFKPPAAMSNVVTREMRVDWDCCKGAAESKVTITPAQN